MNTYNEVIEYLYARLPMFTRDGASAIKKDVDNVLRFCKHLDNPHKKFKSIHIAGTNGKGSSSHMLAAILTAAGYRTGLYTSPHLVDFRERIRIDGKMIEQEAVVAFVQSNKELIETIQPSFFEVTVALAFDYFAKAKVDIAIIEVGLGGRLDSTNIISPELCLITNIGMDHMNLLGNTLVEIAREKAGIIKQGVPVVISERDEQVAQVFEQKAAELAAPIRFAATELSVLSSTRVAGGLAIAVKNKADKTESRYVLELTGLYQLKNVLGVLTAVDELKNQCWRITDDHVRKGLAGVVAQTGLRGRWQTISENPLIICDTGHNEDGIREVLLNLAQRDYKQLHMVIGAMRDKDLSHMLPQLPKDACYYFGSPDMPRALPADELKLAGEAFGLHGDAFDSVIAALRAAKRQFQEGDLIFVGGSTFVVAEVLQDISTS